MGRFDALRILMRGGKNAADDVLRVTLEDGRTVEQMLADDAPELLAAKPPRLPEAVTGAPLDLADLRREVQAKGADIDFNVSTTHLDVGKPYVLRWHEGGEETFNSLHEVKTRLGEVRLKPEQPKFDYDAETTRRLQTLTEEDQIASLRGEPNVVPPTAEELFSEAPDPHAGLEPLLRQPGGGKKHAAVSGDPLGHGFGPGAWQDVGYVRLGRAIKPFYYHAQDIERAGNFPMFTKVVDPMEKGLRNVNIDRAPNAELSKKLTKGFSDHDLDTLGLWFKAPSSVARAAVERDLAMRPEVRDAAEKLEQRFIDYVYEASGGKHRLTRIPVATFERAADNISYIPLPAAKKKEWGFIEHAVQTGEAQSLMEQTNGRNIFDGLIYLAAREHHVTPLYNELLAAAEERVPGTTQRVMPDDFAVPMLDYLNDAHYNPDWFSRFLKRTIASQARLTGARPNRVKRIMASVIGRDPQSATMGAVYGGWLAFRPGPAIRNFLSDPLFLLPDAGLRAYGKMWTRLGDRAYMREALERARRVGYLHGDTMPVYGGADISAARTGASKWGRRLFYDPISVGMWGFGKTDDAVRFKSFETFYGKFMDAADELLKHPKRTESVLRKFTIRSGLIAEQPALKRLVVDKFTKAVDAGDLNAIREAAETYGYHKQNEIVGVYHTRNKPRIFGENVLGRFVGQLGNFPVNSAWWFINRLSNGRAIDRVNFALRWAGASYVTNKIGKDVFGVDLSRYVWLSPMTFKGGYWPEVWRDLQEAMSGGPRADEARTRLMRVPTVFIPGSGLIWDFIAARKALQEKGAGAAAKIMSGFRPAEVPGERRRRKPRSERKMRKSRY